MNLVFDFDGTICDSFDLTLQIANEYLTRLGKKTVEAKDFRECGIEELLKDYKLNKFQILVYIFKGRRELARHIKDLKSFSGLPEVLVELSKHNKLSIISSNSRRNIEKFLKINNIYEYFSFIISSPTIFEKSKKIEYAIRKYNLDKSKTYYIGDEVRDIQAAKRAKVKSIAVSWGFADKKLLEKYDPDLIIQQPLKLLQLYRKRHQI
jgi:phosphoglycolate phosphatase